MHPIKLSSPATREFWEIAVLYEDQFLLAVNKPSKLLTSPDRYDPDRPNLMRLLHAGIAEGKAWARERGLSYLMNAHRLDFDTSGVLLLAKEKPVLVELANMFGSQQPVKQYLALVYGSPREHHFIVEAKLAPHPVRVGRFRVDPKRGKRAETEFEVLEQFGKWTLLRCQPRTGRTHQIRVHLLHAGFPIVADSFYGGQPLLLSRLKSGYRLKPGRIERPLIDRLALHAQRLSLRHPVSGLSLAITAPCPKDMLVAMKYLRRYALGPSSQRVTADDNQ